MFIRTSRFLRKTRSVYPSPLFLLLERLGGFYFLSDEWMNQMRVAIFIDGGYLEKVIKNEFGGLPVDFAKLVEVLVGGRELLRSYYYNCLPYQSNPPTQEEFERFAKKERFFTYNLANIVPKIKIFKMP